MRKTERPEPEMYNGSIRQLAEFLLIGVCACGMMLGFVAAWHL